MDLQKIMKTGEGIEEVEKNLLDLDSEFRFKCRHCGKCCVHQNTIALTARDIFNIAKKQGKSTEAVIKAYTEVYVGDRSRIPVVHLLSNGPKGACPLLVGGRCSVHDCKPTVCALYPLGRVVINREHKDPLVDDMEIETRYIINDYNCGSAKRVNTVRSWLARFGIAEHDDFFILWNKTIITLCSLIRKMEDGKVPEKVLDMLWSTMYGELYIDYDTDQEFMPQFQERADKLLKLARDTAKLPLPVAREDS